MPMSSAERKQLVEELRGEWWTLEQRIPDEQERNNFLWDVAREKLQIDPYVCSLLGNVFEPSRTATALDYICAVVESMKDDEHREYRGSHAWEPSVEWLLRHVVEEDPDGVKTYEGLPEVAADFAEIFLAHQHEIDKSDVSARALHTLARAWAWSTWDEPWYDVMETVPEADWPALALDAIEKSRVGRIEWDRVRELAEYATVSQAIAIIAHDYAPQIRAHAVRLLSYFERDELDEAVDALSRLDPQTDYYDNERRGAVATGIAIACVEAGEFAPEPVVEALGLDLAHYNVQDLELTARALEAVDAERRERLILGILRDGDVYGLPRALGVAYASRSEEVIAEVVQKTKGAEGIHEHIVAGLAGFGSVVVPILVGELRGGDLGSDQAVTFVRALDEIGDPSSAETLVEMTGARIKAVRMAAQTALEHLGSEAIEALQEGKRAGKKAIREACAALLTAIELDAVNPVNELRERMAARDLNKLETTLAQLAESTASTGEDWKPVTAHAEWHGILVLVRLRDWFLENPTDWKRREVWRGTLQYFRRDPDVAWIAVDTFAHLPPTLHSWDVEYLTEQLEVVADRAPEKTGEAIAHYLRGSPPAYEEQLLQILVRHAPAVAPEVFVHQMQSTSKRVRELAIEGLTSLGPAEVLQAVELLRDRKKHARLAAATALQRVPIPQALAEMKRALDRERTADVRSALEQAITAAGGSPFDFPGSANTTAETVDPSKVVDFLEGLRTSELPGFVDLVRLPPLEFRSGQELSGDALESFVNRLTIEGPDTLDQVTRWVRPALDDASADAFGRAIAGQWETAGADASEKWALYQQAILCDDVRIDEVAPGLDEMAGDGNHHVARWYLDALYRSGLANAHSWLRHWAHNAERSSVQSAALELLERAASDAGVSRAAYEATLNTFIADDVAERSIPTLGLEDPIVIDYGDRSFVARLDQNHQLAIRDAASSKAYKRLPSPRKAEKVDEAARDHFRTTRRELKRVVRDVTDRLEQSMVSGRPWSRAAFETLFGDHPIMTPFAGRLVFVTEDGVFFRLSEGDFLGVDWDVAPVADDTTIRLAHPLDMDEESREAWGEHLGDGEVVQPFPQIGRPTFPLDPDFVDSPADLGTVSSSVMVGRLRKVGWRRGIAEDGGILYTAGRLFAGHRVRAWIQHDGYYVADPGWNADEPVGVQRIWFEDPLGEELKLKDVDRRAFSEVRRDLQEVFSSS